MKLGIDIGGTHTDGVLIAEREVIASTKLNTESDKLASIILEACQNLSSQISKEQIKQINLSTTLTTNLIAQGPFPKIGLLLIPGPGLNPSYYQYSPYSEIISGSIDHRGREVAPLNLAELRAALKNFVEKEVRGVAICAKFSPRNPQFEIEIRELINAEFPQLELLSLGHQLAGTLNFPRRAATAYLNTAVLQAQQKFIKNIKVGLAKLGVKASLQILKADGGTMPLAESLRLPIESINSGPAASIMGVMATAKLQGTSLALDIGGSTTDISLFIEQEPLFKPQGIEIANYKTLIRGLYSESLPCGGDSLVQLRDNQLEIKAQRQGKAAAYGGPAPTPSDALVLLGLDKKGNQELARQSLKPLAAQLNLKVEEIATRILELFCAKIKNKVQEILNRLNQQPVYTINELLKEKQINPTTLIVCGGPAAALAPTLADKLELDYQVPSYSPIVNAIGSALTKTTKKASLYADTAQGYYRIPELGISQQIKELDLNDAQKVLKKEFQNRLHDEKSKIQIIKAQSFNMVRGFNTIGKIIEVQAQIKPGLTNKLGKEQNYAN